MPKKKKIKALEAPETSDNAREALEQVIISLKHTMENEGLNDRQIKSLGVAVDALLKVTRNENEIAERYKKLPDEELIRLAKQAARQLKKSNKIIESD